MPDEEGALPPLFLFSHGAGAGIESADCAKWIALLSTIGDVKAFNYSFMGGDVRRKRRAAPRADTLVGEQVAEFERWRAQYPSRPIIMVGRSMGSRVACMASDRVDALAVICLSFPLIGVNGKSRDSELRQMRIPVLCVQGTRDKMCPIVKLNTLASELHCRTEIAIMDGGDHALHVTKKLDQNAADQRALKSIADFVQDILPKADNTPLNVAVP
ncbi:KANL3/Tex30 alpha/beta hydrolase-like domain-containing protein [Plasmodiophora brassicae]|uniref:KANL3/Tex30 alpha/beta hydrolase-like domain-containing protein n=1 Tax=Plasmodiophora brassicae TaxID=37360 RepID=A0A0G4ITF7_PLABS|nr:hypothetical protein PBRA_006505 [Plasmodiophora brassicae]SPQ94477.1 unnamed protein product [Plasmodiophora brassicae]